MIMGYTGAQGLQALRSQAVCRIEGEALNEVSPKFLEVARLIDGLCITREP